MKIWKLNGLLQKALEKLRARDYYITIYNINAR